MPHPAWNLAQCERYILWISRCIAAATERQIRREQICTAAGCRPVSDRDVSHLIPRSIDHYVTGVRAGSQQRGSVKDDGYKYEKCDLLPSGQ
ncbi:hypothetical protein SAMN05192562_103269 [Kosakonia arachidis]|uniref:Uncharacterized protein n=1 Tax=Kosakonia arachidis TaxID=551989 RepID=A0A1I7C638_9ENTR|nr:hypothetical protein SAMN05192562_103269 [Kosakonia arachidis]